MTNLNFKKKTIMTWNEFQMKKGNDWNGYKEYLFENNALSPNLDFIPTKPKIKQDNLL